MLVRKSPLAGLSLAGVFCIVAAAFPARAAEPEKGEGLADYIQLLGASQADLDAGNGKTALERLEKAPAPQRSFEHAYLVARCGAVVDGQSSELIRVVPRPKSVESRYGVLHPLKRQLVYICRDGGLLIHDLTNLEAEPKRVAHDGGAAIWSGCFSLDGKTFVTGHQNGDVLVWDSEEWSRHHTVALGQDWPVRELAVAPDGASFVAEAKSELQLWTLTGDEPKKIAAVGERFTFGEGLAFSPKGDEVATGGMFDILVFDARTGRALHSMRHASYTMGLEYSPDGRRIASAPRGNVNRFLAVFEARGAQPLFNAGPFGNYVAGMAFTPDGKRIIATGCEKLVRLFDAATGDVVLSWKRTECGAKPAFSADGRVVGWSEPDGYMFIDLGPAPAK